MAFSHTLTVTDCAGNFPGKTKRVLNLFQVWDKLRGPDHYRLERRLHHHDRIPRSARYRYVRAEDLGLAGRRPALGPHVLLASPVRQHGPICWLDRQHGDWHQRVLKDALHPPRHVHLRNHHHWVQSTRNWCRSSLSILGGHGLKHVIIVITLPVQNSSGRLRASRAVIELHTLRQLRGANNHLWKLRARDLLHRDDLLHANHNLEHADSHHEFNLQQA